MYTFLLTLLLIDSFALVVVVLLQSGKGGGLAAAFGGAASATESMFGTRGVATFLSKATAVLGGMFMVVAFSLSLLSAQSRSGPTRSLIQEELPSAGAPRPVVPGEEVGPVPLQLESPSPAPEDTAGR